MHKIFSKAFWNRYSANYVLISWLFLRGLALIYFSAFASMAVQIEGLIGAYGILPVTDKLALIESIYPQQKFWQLPTVFWFNASDSLLQSVCYAGMTTACLLFFNIFSRFALFVCYILYLSIVTVGQDFTQFQWDDFLLESGFLAIFLTWGSGITVLLYRWLLARFMFMGGLVKIASGDPSWANLTALHFHYETQPLPSPIAYYAFHLPDWFNKICVAGVFFIELLVPFFVFLPRPFRLFACCSFVLLQSAIILTGNYNFFNLLTLLLCLFLLEDRDIAKIMPQRQVAAILQNKPKPGNLAHMCAGLWASTVLLICSGYIWHYHIKMPLIEPLRSLLAINSKLLLVNNYGPFAVMTTKRNEIIIQGSNDGSHWLNYEFKYKPGKLDHELGWNIPHQPRLDWQMWFAALGSPYKGHWFNNFLIKLLEGSPAVLSLLEKTPFPDRPPVYIRAMVYHYSYTSLTQHARNGQIWQRQGGQLYSQVHTLSVE